MTTIESDHLHLDASPTAPPPPALTMPTGAPPKRSAAPAIAGLLLALTCVALGLVMRSNAQFADRYLSDQLGQQRITFKPVDQLTPKEREAPCLVRYAGQRLTTGPQAECFANDFIGLHLQQIGGGKTYAEMDVVLTGLRAEVAAAERSGAADLPAAQARLAAATQQRETLFKGETLRGLLLTSFGFSTLGAKAGEAQAVAFLGAGLLSAASVGWLVATGRRRSADAG